MLKVNLVCTNDIDLVRSFLCAAILKNYNFLNLSFLPFLTKNFQWYFLEKLF